MKESKINLSVKRASEILEFLSENGRPVSAYTYGTYHPAAEKLCQAGSFLRSNFIINSNSDLDYSKSQIYAF